MSSSQSDFYERIDEIISPQKTEKGIYLKDFASFWVQSKGLLLGQIIRIVWSPSFKSSYPAFEWKEDASKKGKSSICIKCWLYTEVGLMWKLHPQNEFQSCDPKSMLEKYQIDSEANVLIDPSKLKQMLPKLEKLEAERIERERKKKKQDREEAKKGEPDSMTKELLKEILTEHGVAFKKSSSKQELIAKELELRRQLETRPTNGTCEAINGPSPRPDRSDEHTVEVTII